MRKKAVLTNDYRAVGDPLKKFYLLERRYMAKAGSYTASRPDKYGTRGMWSLFDVIDNYADALDAFHNALLDYTMSRDYDWRLSVWAAKDGPDGATYHIQTISQIDTDQPVDRSILTSNDDIEKTLDRESEGQFADLMSGATDNEEDPEEEEEEQ